MQSTELAELQESEEGVGVETDAVNRLSKLSLNNDGGDHHHYHHSNTTTMKRRSPSSSSPSLQEPTTKKRPLPLQPSSATADHHLHGLTKLPLPPLSPIISPPPSHSTSIPSLRRCLFDPIISPESNNLGVFPKPYSPQNNVQINGSAIKALQPNLRRSVSYPIHSPSSRDVGSNSIKSPENIEINGSSIKSKKPNLLRSVSDPIHSLPSSIDMGLNSIERLKRMKECMDDMSQWSNEILHEAEGDAGLEDYTNITPPTTKEESENEAEEPVSVEKTGECLIINFKCPCTKGYQILLSGTNCYYKLM